jgi:hypothetical protein
MAQLRTTLQEVNFFKNNISGTMEDLGLNNLPLGLSVSAPIQACSAMHQHKHNLLVNGKP